MRSQTLAQDEYHLSALVTRRYLAFLAQDHTQDILVHGRYQAVAPQPRHICQEERLLDVLIVFVPVVVGDVCFPEPPRLLLGPILVLVLGPELGLGLISLVLSPQVEHSQGRLGLRRNA